jgi:hypothetical protein
MDTPEPSYLPPTFRITNFTEQCCVTCKEHPQRTAGNALVCSPSVRGVLLTSRTAAPCLHSPTNTTITRCLVRPSDNFMFAQSYLWRVHLFMSSGFNYRRSRRLRLHRLAKHHDDDDDDSKTAPGSGRDRTTSAILHGYTDDVTKALGQDSRCYARPAFEPGTCRTLLDHL